MRIEVGHNDGRSGPRNRGPRATFSHSSRISITPKPQLIDGRRQYGSSKSDPVSCLKCCVCFWIILPIVLTIAGIIVIGAENNRVQRIEE